jgi:hypothetical protein
VALNTDITERVGRLISIPGESVMRLPGSRLPKDSARQGTYRHATAPPCVFGDAS